MKQSLIRIILSVAISLQPMAFYPTPAFAQDANEKNPTEPTLDLTPSLTNLQAKIKAATWNFVRNQTFGDTPGSNKQLVPSASQILDFDRELQVEKKKLFARLQQTLSNPLLISARKPESTPIEWLMIGQFYSMAADLEYLKALNGSMPDPKSWNEKYGLQLKTAEISDAYFSFAIQKYIVQIYKDKSTNFPFVIHFRLNGFANNSFDFQLNPLLASQYAEKLLIANASDDQMLRLAQYTAADQLYDSMAAIHTLGRHELTSLPELPSALKEKFPMLEWKRGNYIMSNSMRDQLQIISPLADKKIGALVEKLNREKRYFFDQETALKVYQTMNPGNKLDINSDPDLQEAYKNLLETEQSANFGLLLRTLLISTEFNPAKANEFWTQNIKTVITQAKLSSAIDTFLNGEQIPDSVRNLQRSILIERAGTYLQDTLKDFDVPLIVKYIQDEQTYLKVQREQFQRQLWMNAKRIETAAVVERDPVDLTVIADDLFIDHLNASLNKPDAAPVETGKKKVQVQPIRPNTAMWLSELFQPNKSYGTLREEYRMAIFNALNDFKTASADNSVEKSGSRDIETLKKWLQQSQYDINSLKLNPDPKNHLALDLRSRAPEARKQELLELIRIGENLGFFANHELGAKPLVGQMPWGAGWLEAYQAVMKKRIIAENPLLAMKLSDGSQEGAFASAWSDVVYASNVTFDWVFNRYTVNSEKSFWQELVPLYENEIQVKDEAIDGLVTTYLNKMNDIILRDLIFVGEQGAEKKASWDPRSWSLFTKEQKTLEFSSEFKKIIGRSFVLTAKLNEYARFQNAFEKMQERLNYSNAYSQAYDEAFNTYVGSGMLAVIGLGILGFSLKYTTKKGYDLFHLVQTETLVPIFGKNLRYYQWPALAWFLGDLAGRGVDIFAYQRPLRERVSDMAFSSAAGPGLVDMNMKEDMDQTFATARAKWQREVVFMAAVLGAVGLGMPLGGMAKRGIEGKGFKKWAAEVKKLSDDAGFQDIAKSNQKYVGLLKGDIQAMETASREHIAARVAAAQGKKSKLNDMGINLKPTENWVKEEYFTAEINAAREKIYQMVDEAAVKWAAYGQKYAHQFNSLRMKPGQWDLLLFDRRMKDIKEAFANKSISLEQKWILEQYLQELILAYKPYHNMMMQIPVVGPAIIERIAASAANLRFDATGRLVGVDLKHIPQLWIDTATTEGRSLSIESFKYLRAAREETIGLRWTLNPKTGRKEPYRYTNYSIDARSEQSLRYEKMMQEKLESLK